MRTLRLSFHLHMILLTVLRKALHLPSKLAIMLLRRVVAVYEAANLVWCSLRMCEYPADDVFLWMLMQKGVQPFCCDK